MQRKIAVLEAVKDTYSGAASYLPPILLWSVPYFIISVPGVFLLKKQEVPTVTSLAASIGLGFVQILFWGPVLIWLHRAILMKSPQQGNFFASLLSRRNFKYVGVALLYSALVGVMVGIPGGILGVVFTLADPTTAWLVATAVGGITAVAIFYISARVFLTFPLVAIDAASAYRKSLEMSRGNVLAICAVLVLAVLPLSAVSMAAGVSLTAMIQGFLAGGAAIDLVKAGLVYAAYLVVGVVPGILLAASASFCAKQFQAG